MYSRFNNNNYLSSEVHILSSAMCYCPLGCLKFIVGLGAVLSIVVSLGLLALTIYANVQKKQIISNTGGQFVNDALVGLYLGAAVFMILGICGVYGAMKTQKKQKKSGNCFLFFYLIGVFVFFALFVSATIFFFVGPEAIFKDDCTTGSKTTLVDQLYKLSNKADEQFCTSKCPCFINSTNSNSYLSTQLQKRKDFQVSTNQSYKYYQACLSAEDQKSSNVLLLGALEELLGCGGWCPNDAPKHYKFYDINLCVSEECLTVDRKGCHEAFSTFLTGKGQIMGFACGIATLLCLINIITVCCICYHPDKTKKGANFYSRMMDQ